MLVSTPKEGRLNSDIIARKVFAKNSRDNKTPLSFLQRCFNRYELASSFERVKYARVTG